ncbi:DUF4309 domain-containing protein [Paenibacillus sp. SYP-B3998]|uniref:DUF4309 domain-containing protein n=1 Tax=Paenibacillus sp. SYP-B3998 TaxID=2678564 RepID=A0A6G4A3Y7_9BACL|nr:DUF4309 domain-containing protein [Paenibacillus sp. SYP-B3998]NEW08654.1 DUF4309 domain-containing protein [Paenibacillus sp. SYP-B3998]
MNKPFKLIVLGCVPVAFASLLVVGCQKSSVPSAHSPIESPAYEQSMTQESRLPVAVSPTSVPTATPDDKAKHEAQVAGSAKSDYSDIPKSAASAKPTAKPKIKAEDTYKQENPTLMGLKLGAAKTTVLDSFGKAKKQFVMDEDEDAIQVYDYSDFSVGFNKKDQLEFVDVHSVDIDPGLRGLKLGQNMQDVITILGKPDANTTYVLSYKSQNTILKIDIDPKESTIQSIKLFADR